MFRVSVAIALTLAVPAIAQDAAPTTPLQEQVQAMVSAPDVARAHWGVEVTRLDGTPLVEINAGQLFQPASNAKLFTTATAMALLPVDARLSTTLMGKVEGAMVVGDLALKGAADANLSARTLPYVPRAMQPKSDAPPNELRYLDELAAQVAAKGITRVSGNVVGDDSLMPWQPYPPDWAIDDAVWYYGAPITALMIADNAIHLSVAPGARAGAPAIVTLNPAMTYYVVRNNVTTAARGGGVGISIDRATGSKVLMLRGSIGLGAPAHNEDIAIDDPALYAAQAMRAALMAHGVAVTGTAVVKHGEAPMFPASTSAIALDAPAAWPSLKPVFAMAAHVASPLYDDIVATNKSSQNQHAELLLRDLGLAFGAEGSTHEGVRVVRAFLTERAGVDPNDFSFVDGSGLSEHDLVTPRAVAQLLRYGRTQPWGTRWAATLPVGGEDGSLANRFGTPLLKDHVIAKTGTLGEVRALSGYLTCASGETLVFSILVNNHLPASHADTAVTEQILELLAQRE